MTGRLARPRRTPFANVFVLCTGRCGSLTFAQACQAGIDNYSAAHETNLARSGPARLDYPDGHIEVDNRLAWFLGRLHARFGDGAFYVHLTRDPAATARSYARRRALGFLLHAWMRGIYVGLEDVPDHEALARDLVDTVNANIRLFLAARPHRMAFALENAREHFPVFCEAIGAEGPVDRGLAAWSRRYNATVIPAAEAARRRAPAGADADADADADGRVPEAAEAPAATFAANAPLPASVHALMSELLPGAPMSAAQPSVSGRDPDLDRHLVRVANDFAGQPALCRHVADLIVRIRRGLDLEDNVERLFCLTRHPQSGDFLARRLSLRWLVSVLDTQADHAPMEEAAAAMALSLLVNTVKLAETERLIVNDPAHDPARIEALAQAFPVPLFGGLNAFRLQSGDMVANLFARLERLVMDRPFHYAALDRVRDELRRSPNLFSRLAAYHPRLF